MTWGSKTTQLSGPNMTPRWKRRQSKRSSKPRTKVDKKLSRRISKLENRREIKYKDLTASAIPTTDGVVLSLVNTITRGDQYNERDGDNIFTKKVRLSYILTKPAITEGQGAPYQIRCILFWDKVTSGGSTFQLFTGTAPDAKQLSCSLLDDRDGMTTINSPYSENTRDRFKILYDRIHVINNFDPFQAKSLVVRKTIPLSGAKVEYVDVDYDVNPIEQLPERNLVFVYFCAGSTTTAMNFTSRVFYTDD